MDDEIKIEFISEGFRKILTSENVRALVEGEATKIQERANSMAGGRETEGFVVNTMMGDFGKSRNWSPRWISNVQAADYEAAVAAAEDKVLDRAVK